MNLLPGDTSGRTVIKAVVVGETEVGKTSLCNRYYSKKFDPLTAATISASCIRNEINVNDQQVMFCVWDTAGQERFRSISPLYYRGSHVAIIVIDLTNAHSLEAADLWVQELKEKGPPEIPLVVLGNKSDLKDRIGISAEAAAHFTKTVGADYIEVSALSGAKVDEAFEIAALKALNYFRKISTTTEFEAHNTNIEPISEANEKKSKCC